MRSQLAGAIGRFFSGIGFRKTRTAEEIDLASGRTFGREETDCGNSY